MTFTVPDIAWAQLTPVLIVLGAAVVGVLVEALVPRRVRRVVQLTLTLAALGGAVVAVAALWNGVADTGGTEVLGGPCWSTARRWSSGRSPPCWHCWPCS